ncbi:DUF982 domain-containing protein [Rhizobium leguminosarum]|uniref:DUF982 domain-containing protein n=1 Tax=Rhizobium leguminosarum TaxID=384 RepID=UPI001C965B5F|nr:DUF982 domain-containing protein [Rhizobium leguminosarum]MBY5660432.1 DUF982 domain-containing protein [Rhizobium leguminosarum]MBY5674055.1 DUF982 domain-containing protein [Rhizobium leguminosarum]
MNEIEERRIREVAIGFPEFERFSTATTVTGLMGILMSDRWPKRASDTTWQHALATCTRCLQLETDTSKARSAFVEAARQAGLKVLPDDAWQPIRRIASANSHPPVQRRQPHAR